MRGSAGKEVEGGALRRHQHPVGPRAEDVVGDEGGNRGEEAAGRRGEDGADRSGERDEGRFLARPGEAREGAHDPDDGAGEADEGGEDADEGEEEEGAAGQGRLAAARLLEPLRLRGGIGGTGETSISITVSATAQRKELRGRQ